MLDVLIVKTDRDHVTIYALEIIRRCNDVLPAIQIDKRSVADTAGEKHALSCKKLLFLLDADSTDVAGNVARWTAAVFPKLKDFSEKVLVVYESVGKNEVKFSSFETQKTSILKTVVIKTLKDVFQWWPRVLDFIYQRKPIGAKVFLKTDVDMKREDDADTESLDAEQSKLKKDISDLLEYNIVEQTDKDENMVRCKMVIVVFGRDKSVSESMDNGIRLAKINGTKVLFFFPYERSFDREIKRISTKCYTVSQHMEGIAFIVRNTAMKKYKIPLIQKPLIPTGPLSISNVYNATIGMTMMDANWFPYPYGLGETISIQARVSSKVGKVWIEIARDIPATQSAVSIQTKKRLSSSMSDFRIMCEDKDGNLSRGIKPNSIGFSSVSVASDTLMVLEETKSGFAVYKPDENPVHMRCPFCETEIDTVPIKKVGRRASVWCIMLASFGCIPCCWIPFILCKDIAHTCPDCQQEVRRYNGLQ